MQLEDMILVSVDDHVVEPRDMFDNHLPAKWKDQAPKSVKKPDGTDVWVYEDAEIPNIGLNAVAGRPPEEYNFNPTAYDDVRAGCYDVKERVKDMDRNGVLASAGCPCFREVRGQVVRASRARDVV